MAEFWTTVSATSADPKRGFRWQISFDNLGGTDPIIWFAKKVTKPNFSITESKHSFLNHNYYWPGRVEWQEISLTLVDPVTPNAVANTNKIIAAMGYAIPSGTTAADMSSMSKGKAKSALGEVVISQLNAKGVEIEQWTLKQAWLKTCKFGELSYEDDNLIEIELGIRYDWATCVIAGEEGSPYYSTETSAD